MDTLIQDIKSFQKLYAGTIPFGIVMGLSPLLIVSPDNLDIFGMLYLAYAARSIACIALYHWHKSLFEHLDSMDEEKLQTLSTDQINLSIFKELTKFRLHWRYGVLAITGLAALILIKTAACFIVPAILLIPSFIAEGNYIMFVKKLDINQEYYFRKKGIRMPGGDTPFSSQSKIGMSDFHKPGRYDPGNASSPFYSSSHSSRNNTH